MAEHIILHLSSNAVEIISSLPIPIYLRLKGAGWPASALIFAHLFVARVAVGTLNQVKQLLNVGRHFIHVDASLLSAVAFGVRIRFWQGTPAANTGNGSAFMSSQNWKYS